MIKRERLCFLLMVCFVGLPAVLSHNKRAGFNENAPRMENGVERAINYNNIDGNNIEKSNYDVDGRRAKRHYIHHPMSWGESIQLSIVDRNVSQIDYEKRNKVKEMMVHAWKNYKLFAWGKDSLRPHSERPFTEGKRNHDSGTTIVVSLDTLYIMGLTAEFQEGRDWIAKSFSFENVTDYFSVYELNVRYVGGLLSLYAFTGDNLFKAKAQYVADKLLPAFQTPTGIPNSHVNMETGASRSSVFISRSILADLGTLHMEFAYLSDVTGNPVYRERVQKVRQILRDLVEPKGVYPIYLNPETGKSESSYISLGERGGSFYEYLIKEYIRSGQSDEEPRDMFVDAMTAIMKYLIVTSPNGLIYAADMINDKIYNSMEHVACFAGGMFALAAHTLQNQHTEKYMEVGAGITNTCHESYIRTSTHLAPYRFSFTDEVEAIALKYYEHNYYDLASETFESYFILWRLTHDQKYRDWGWDAIQAIEKYCRTPNGYCGLNNVYRNTTGKDDVQHSRFMSEALKYLYLLYSDDSLISLDKWTFNTRGHPLPIKGATPLYRMEKPPPSVHQD